jgi:hypothetical protein
MAPESGGRDAFVRIATVECAGLTRFHEGRQAVTSWPTKAVAGPRPTICSWLDRSMFGRERTALRVF